MPRLCAFGCKPTGVPTHRFPNYKKNPERFKLWVNLCGGKLDATSDYECYIKKIVCDKHFTDNDRNRNQRLNALAVPSRFLSGLTSGALGLQKACVLQEHNYSAASRHKRLVSKCTGPRFNSAQYKNMRSQIKTLRSQICHMKKNKTFQASLANARKLTENLAFQQVVSRMTKPSQLFVNMQVQAAKKPKGRHFTIEEKVLAVSI